MTAEDNMHATIRALKARIAELEQQVCDWRACAQRMTPGGSEFMAIKAVEAHYTHLRDRFHKAQLEAARLRKALLEIENPWRPIPAPPTPEDTK